MDPVYNWTKVTTVIRWSTPSWAPESTSTIFFIMSIWVKWMVSKLTTLLWHIIQSFMRLCLSSKLFWTYVLKRDTVAFQLTSGHKNIGAMPDEGSLLWAQMEDFSKHDSSNTTIVNFTRFYQIANGIVTSNARPALWFYATGGSVFITLALTSLMGRIPRGEWGILQTAYPQWFIIYWTQINMNGVKYAAGSSWELL